MNSMYTQYTCPFKMRAVNESIGSNLAERTYLKSEHESWLEWTSPRDGMMDGHLRQLLLSAVLSSLQMESGYSNQKVDLSSSLPFLHPPLAPGDGW